MTTWDLLISWKDPPASEPCIDSMMAAASASSIVSSEVSMIDRIIGHGTAGRRPGSVTLVTALHLGQHDFKACVNALPLQFVPNVAPP